MWVKVGVEAHFGGPKWVKMSDFGAILVHFDSFLVKNESKWTKIAPFWVFSKCPLFLV